MNYEEYKETKRKPDNLGSERTFYITNLNFRIKERFGFAEVSQFRLKMPAMTGKHLLAHLCRF